MICPGELFDLVWNCWRSLDLGIVRIGDQPLGMRGGSATWGTGADQKVREELCDGGAQSEVLIGAGAGAPWLRRGLPSDDGSSERQVAAMKHLLIDLPADRTLVMPLPRRPDMNACER